MNVWAIVVEQLERDGRLKSFHTRSMPELGDMVVAYLDEYDEERDGPFHFLDPRYRDHFRNEKAQCQIRKLGRRSFRNLDAGFWFRTSWKGIPTGDNGLSLYALCLPPGLGIDELEFIYPPLPTYSIRHDEKTDGIVLYLECRAHGPSFDFELQITAIEGIGSRHQGDFGHPSGYLQYYLDNNRLKDLTVNQTVNFFDLQRGDRYEAGVAGVQGPNARIDRVDVTDARYSQPIDYEVLAQQLARLMEEIVARNANEDTIASLKEAESAALRRDENALVSSLSRAGKGALQVARDIGVDLVASIIARSLGW